jgi:hypothetical protein
MEGFVDHGDSGGNSIVVYRAVITRQQVSLSLGYGYVTSLV